MSGPYLPQFPEPSYYITIITFNASTTVPGGRHTTYLQPLPRQKENGTGEPQQGHEANFHCYNRAAAGKDTQVIECMPSTLRIFACSVEISYKSLSRCLDDTQSDLASHQWILYTVSRLEVIRTRYSNFSVDTDTNRRKRHVERPDDA